MKRLYYSALLPGRKLRLGVGNYRNVVRYRGQGKYSLRLTAVVYACVA